MKSILPSGLLLLLLLLADAAHAQSNAIPDSVRTVAIYSSKNNFLTEYTVDTLVAHLNRFKKSKRVRYFVNTKDDTRSGYYADHVVDIDLDLREPVMGPPRYETVNVSRPTVQRGLNPATGNMESRVVYVNTPEQRYHPGTMQPAKASVRLRMLDRKNNQKVTKDGFMLQHEQQVGLEINLILQLHQMIQANYDKP
ncbi:hypothetical protein [Flaviaesturariibacter amylovorans]|uniref:DUF4136 domain-containing protein n=1 Tax=Flaviaesturariibacter amylovorans TaxID=1084520 RepID=A0ABP8H7Y1_9BACT